MSTHDSRKEVVRKHYLEQRRAMHPDVWKRASMLIHSRIEHSDLYRNCETLLTYVSAKDNEVGTTQIIESALRSGRTVIVPIVVVGKSELSWAQIKNSKELVRGKFGLLEPKWGQTHFVDIPSVALCLTPGVAFTCDGWRIGYGGGYYDRFLAKFAGISIGLAFDAQIACTLPQDEFDQRVDYVFTETQCYTANSEN